MITLKRSLTTILIFYFFYGNCQTQKTINKLESNHQICLDKSENMDECSRRYYFQMDSLLSAVYEKTEKKLNLIQKLKLKKDQENWLLKRKKFESKQNKIFQKKIKSQEWGNDMYIIVYQNDAEFIRERIIRLLKLE